MAVMKSRDGRHLSVDCECGCNDGFRIQVNHEDKDGLYFLASYTSGNFYKDQNATPWRTFTLKLKKIWRIIRNKDFYYSEICMTKEDFKEFQDYIQSIEA